MSRESHSAKWVSDELLYIANSENDRRKTWENSGEKRVYEKGHFGEKERILKVYALLQWELDNVGEKEEPFMRCARFSVKWT